MTFHQVIFKINLKLNSNSINSGGEHCKLTIDCMDSLAAQFEIILSSLIKWEILANQSCYRLARANLNGLGGYQILIMGSGRFFSNINHEVSINGATGWDTNLPYNHGAAKGTLGSTGCKSLTACIPRYSLCLGEEISANFIKKLQTQVPIFTWSNAIKAQLSAAANSNTDASPILMLKQLKLQSIGNTRSNHRFNNYLKVLISHWSPGHVVDNLFIWNLMNNTF
ncbi:hypothetical protein CYY_007002 [Polysphondylium violaceum]|uniref:Uncharacterized protein n=1 Tax=Polysphondylium violaceum TaxID=133409 RepID=A0A8J4UR65_9MYCE|nr:hypothetical protein CYY_007002 [Polysphondylium violaceum]